MSNTSCQAPFWKRRLFYSKIACFLQKVWDFGRFFKKQKAPFYVDVFRSFIVQKKLTYILVIASLHAGFIGSKFQMKRRLFQTTHKISKYATFSKLEQVILRGYSKSQYIYSATQGRNFFQGFSSFSCNILGLTHRMNMILLPL